MLTIKRYCCPVVKLLMDGWHGLKGSGCQKHTPTFIALLKLLYPIEKKQQREYKYNKIPPVPLSRF